MKLDTDRKYFLRILVLVAVTFTSAKSQSADSVTTKVTDTISGCGGHVYTIVEEMPKFPGGEEKMLEYLAKNIRMNTSQEEPQSRIYLNFVVDTSGNVVNPSLNRTYYSDRLTNLEKEVFRVLNEMPKWIPGRQNNQKVCVQFSLPMHIHMK